MDRKDPPATLSRSTLYAPLQAYQQTRVTPAEYTRTSTKVPKELHESSLYKFLQHVSNHHHVKPTQLHAKNTSAKPLKDYAERIQQRALNLVGGGFYGGGVKTKSQRSKAPKRRQLSQQKLSLSGSDETTIKSDNLFLDNLNKLWNDYARNVLQRESEVKPTMSEMEWVGALVRIDACPAFRDWKGSMGTVIRHTKISWHVCIKAQNKTKKQVFKLLYLPKATTTLSVLIPKSTRSSSKEQSDTEYLCTLIQGEHSK